MPTISDSVTTVAGVTTANVLSGNPFEFLTRPRNVVSLYVSSAAATTTAIFQIGGRTIFQGGLVPGTNRFPLRQEDGVVQSRGVAGERMFLTFNDPAAVAVRFLIDIA